MRLLSRVDGILSLTADVPAEHPYAILSHTWGKDEEEVTYLDILNGDLDKVGFEKIDFCLDQAAEDGYQYVWVDTCCIDKRDRNELGKAINQMFDYYRDSAVCYVYLTDVEPDSSEISGSRWFTRGWTLQELVAPKSVLFYASGRFMGDRKALREQIKIGCGIDTAEPLEHATLVQRFQWSLNRVTREPEDRHYCLIGLLKLEMKPIFNYGEGEASALHRLDKSIRKNHGFKVLSEIQKARLEAPSTTARTAQIRLGQALNSLRFLRMDARREDISDPLPGTCTWLRRHADFKAWYSMRGRRFLWIKGKPGAGKSTIMKYAASLAGSSRQPGMQISYYFNARGTELERCAVGMYRSLLCQLVESIAELRDPFLEIIQSSNSTLSWPLNRLKNVLAKTIKKLEVHVRCFIDALDEGATEDVQNMIYFLQDLTCPFLHICFASRHYPTVSIKHSIEIVLDNLHDNDIKRYVNRRLDAGDDNDLGDRLRLQIMDKAKGIFLWAVLVVEILNKEVREGRIFNLEAKLQGLPPSLASLFESIVMQATEDDGRFRMCLRWILFSDRPMDAVDFYYAMEITSRPGFPCYMVSGVDAMVNSKHIAKLVSSSSRGLAELSGDRVQAIHESVRTYLLSHNVLNKLHPGVKGDIRHHVYHDLQCFCQKYISIVLDARPSVEGWTTTFGHEVRYNYYFLSYAADSLIFFAEACASHGDNRAATDILGKPAWTTFYTRHLQLKFERDNISNLDSHPIVMRTLVLYEATNLLQQVCSAGQSAVTEDLFFAIRTLKFDAAYALVDFVQDLEAKNDENETVLLALTHSDNVRDAPVRLVEKLAQNKADIEASDVQGDTPLIRAIRGNRVDIAKLLVSFGAAIDATNAAGESAVTIVRGSAGRIDMSEEDLHRRAALTRASTTGSMIGRPVCI